MLSVVLLDWCFVSETSNEHKKDLCTGHNLFAYFEAEGVTQKPEKQERETLFHFGVVKSLVPDICFERGLLAFPRECPKGVEKSFALRLSLLSLLSNRRER